jgi:hypothetical protein
VDLTGAPPLFKRVYSFFWAVVYIIGYSIPVVIAVIFFRKLYLVDHWPISVGITLGVIALGWLIKTKNDKIKAKKWEIYRVKVGRIDGYRRRQRKAVYEIEKKHGIELTIEERRAIVLPPPEPEPQPIWKRKEKPPEHIRKIAELEEEIRRIEARQIRTAGKRNKTPTESEKTPPNGEGFSSFR